jgi:alkylhydroperoxidase/carboxymuconolactone decarboxylase family protein YurZ
MKKKTSRPPSTHQRFVRRFPRLGEAWDLVNQEGGAGPLHAKTRRLLKLAIAIGAMREGAVHSGVRKARDAGASVAEMEQVVALAASTIGFPARGLARDGGPAVLSASARRHRGAGLSPGSPLRLPRAPGAPRRRPTPGRRW